MTPDYRWASDHGLLVTFGDTTSKETEERVLGAIDLLRRVGVPGLRNIHPAYTSVLLVCDPLAVTPEVFERVVRRELDSVAAIGRTTRRKVDIPVCYAPELGLDLGEVARTHQLAVDEVARLHSSAEYVVSFLGFTPGFPYLTGLPPVLATPRLAVPRKRVPAGSVAIGGAQAGIYPFPTPGGWRIIGRTPLEIFRIDRDPPAVLSAGDLVRFVPISAEDFRKLARREGQPRG